MQNKVTLTKQGIIETYYRGNQTAHSIQAVTDQYPPLIDRLNHQYKPILILVDISAIGLISYGARQQSIHTLRRLTFDKMAIHGASLYLTHLANLILHIVDKNDRIRQFDSRAEALRWLMSYVSL